MTPSESLLEWYEHCGRDLPWRGTTDPYKILVSEIMLQQTQVSRGLVFFDRWLEEFPDWQSLSKASNADVIKAWSGLGYNRRALMLRDIAREIIKTGVPQSEENWKKLKGVGDYTAAALTVFSLGKPAIPVDTNIRRVIGRIFLADYYPDPKNDAEIKTAAKPLFHTPNFQNIPQAIFDLATMVCKKVPDCEECPMREHCALADDFISGQVQPPKRMTKKPKERIQKGKKHPDRIYRGRILSLAKEQGRVEINAIGPQIDKTFTKKDQRWIEEMIARLTKDKLISTTKSHIELSTD